MGVEPLVPPESFFVQAMKKEGPLLAGKWSVLPPGLGCSAKSTRHQSPISSRNDSRKGRGKTWKRYV
jgi:hypothetical protein